MALNEVLNEIRASRTGGETAHAPVGEAPAQKAKKKERKMTKAELEAFRARKMREEEERYLGKQSKKAKPQKAKAAARTDLPIPEQVRQAVEIAYANPNPPREPNRPKMLEPLQPLYLLKIPGMPKGDCLAVCLVHGV